MSEFASDSFNTDQLNALVKAVGPENVLGILRGELRLNIQAVLLRRIGDPVSVSGAKRLFVAKDQIEAANVGWMNDTFRKLFLNKVEKNVGEASLAIHELRSASLDPPILAELGDRAEVRLAHFFELLKKQSKGKEGPLLVNDYANIAYVRDGSGTFWAVYANWYSVGRSWFVHARSVVRPDRWFAGARVLSHDS